MWSGLLSAALLYGVLSTTIVVAQQQNGADPTLTTTPLTSIFPTVTGPGERQGTTSSDAIGGKDTNIHTLTASDSTVDGSGGITADASTSETNGPKASGVRNNNTGTPSVASDLKASGGKSNNTGAIAGGVVGGVLFLVLVGALIFFLRKRKKARDPFGSMEKSADERAANNESPSPLPPAPIVAASAAPHPHHNPTTPNEAHALMSHYGDAQPQHMPQEVQPVIMPAKPYDVNPSSREIRDGDEDDDGVSINSPSPVTTPSPERQQEQQRSVPRLPIYQGGRKDDDGGNTPPPAL